MGSHSSKQSMSAAGDSDQRHSGRVDRLNERDKIEKLSGAGRPRAERHTEQHLDLRDSPSPATPIQSEIADLTS
jgi:hypothetical protein